MPEVVGELAEDPQWIQGASPESFLEILISMPHLRHAATCQDYKKGLSDYEKEVYKLKADLDEALSSWTEVFEGSQDAVICCSCVVYQHHSNACYFIFYFFIYSNPVKLAWRYGKIFEYYWILLVTITQDFSLHYFRLFYHRLSLAIYDCMLLVQK